ncbi:MAG TPA: GTPase HflX [Xanthobacteraceae bacterium]|nr:GTPase HflX [Xanthobacteraceae bacterium]
MEPRRRDTRADRLSPKDSVSGRSATGRALVIEPMLRRAEARAKANAKARAKERTKSADRTSAAKLDEAVGLAHAIDLDVAHSGVVMLNALRPATYLGKGKVEEIAGLVKSFEIGIVVMDCALTPIQQRNLEKEWNAKVLDRTSLILEIFGRRARTREGALQVEHAHLTYQKSRLVRTWTHLERQRGGFGFLGGPGETQLEADRRLIEERLAKIETELTKVKRTRELHRESRRRVPYPIVALVGYTNAGKSTLFNRMTRATVLSADMLFATLDPTLRAVDLPHGARVILSDTVGFISDLPTMLIAAFRATLEEVIEADVILHVRDISHEDAEAQSADVENILRQLGIDPRNDSNDKRALIEVWNKIDRVDAEQRARLANIAERSDAPHTPVLTSALTGEGLDAVLATIETRLGAGRVLIELDLDPSDGAGVSWLHRHTEVIHKAFDKNGRVAMTVRADPDKAKAVRTKFARALHS